MRSPFFTVVYAVLTFLVTTTTAFFKIQCPSRLVLERSDPIISPGQSSAHVHTIVGGNGFSQSMDYAQTQTATCSTCKVPADKSNYWTPSLYFHDGKGGFTSVPQMGGFLVYYLVKFDKGKDEKSITAFKPGFRMVTGDPFARSADSGLPSQAIKFLCHNSEESAQGFPKQPCAGGIRTRLIFPSCSNGQLDSPDHKSHMAYPSGIEGGECPPGFPVRHPTLLYESVWQTQQFDKMWPQQGSNPFVLSNGDPTGFGFHGDFLNGWDEKVLQDAILNCKDGNRATDNKGDIKFCPVLAPTLYSDDQCRKCKKEPQIAEMAEGQLGTLLGCNPIQPGPGPANKSPGCGGPKRRRHSRGLNAGHA